MTSISFDSIVKFEWQGNSTEATLMNRFDRKDVMGLLATLAVIAIIPLSLVLTRPRPLSADTAAGLMNLARSSRQDEILEQMVRRYEAVSLNFEGPDVEADPKVGWHRIETTMEQNGAESDVSQQVIRAAQSKLKQEWPCLVERGYLRNQPVWLVVGSSPHAIDFLGWICPPSANDIRMQRIEKYCTNTQVAVVAAEFPYRLMQ